MIKILIVDDSSDKIQNIIKAIKTIVLIDEENIDYVLDTTNGRKKLEENVYDLLILDMNLPTAIGDTPTKNGGLELLEKIHTQQIANFPHHIIGLTGFEDIFNDSKKELEKYLWTLIHYDNTTNEWKEKIINKIQYLIDSKQNMYGACFEKFDIAVITALEDPELSAVLNLPCNWNKFSIPNDPTVNYFKGVLEYNEKSFSIVVANTPKMGMVASSILTTKICCHFHPKYFFMVGIAAGIKDKNNFGDILIAEYSWDWGSGKITSEFKPDHTQISLDPTIIAKLKEINSEQSNIDKIKNQYTANIPSTSLKMYIGPIASGASVLENENEISDIQTYQRKLIGIEMEIYGVMSAIKYSVKPSPIGICIKSVSDFGDNNKNDDWQHYAAYTSTKMMQLLIEILD